MKSEVRINKVISEITFKFSSNIILYALNFKNHNMHLVTAKKNPTLYLFVVLLCHLQKLIN